jgi:hypothetical protein
VVDEFKSIRDNLFKVLTGKSGERGDDGDDDLGGGPSIDAGAARALIATVFARAGKGKDEVVQIIAREIGMAVAAMLKEPLAQLAKHQKLQISFEFVPKAGKAGEPDPEADEGAPPPKPRRHRASGHLHKKRSSHRKKADIGG